jgi:SulP family sulfate permease
MGAANLIIALFGGIPLCHGAGGLAAHYRFGARTGGSNLIIGGLFIAIALLFGTFGITLLSSLPNAVLGILLMFAGLELAVLIKDLDNKKELYVTILIASIGFLSTNMSIAFAIGILVNGLIHLFKVEF